MSPSKTISIVGAGPGGLFLAILLRQARPDWTIRMWERNAPTATFGFGVVFSDRTVELLDKADPQSLSLIREDFQSWTDIEVGTWNGARRTGGHGFSAIARHRLLEILQNRARDLGISVHYETEVPNLDEVYATSDVVVGADGINSQVRSHWESEFVPDIRIGRARFIWFATPRRYDALTFHFVETEFGPFSTHAYPFSKDLSTFIVETDEETWRRSGMDRPGLDPLEIGESDISAMNFCQEIFSDSLQGHNLVGNASQWRQFPTVRNKSWTAADKVVILGDAAHTAHFSVGSGTKMAMEDAAALAQFLTDNDEPAEALREFETARKTAVGKIQSLAEPSRGWWENFHLWADRDIDSFTVNFLSRTGRETADHLAQRDPDFTSTVIDSGVLETPLSIGSEVLLSNRRGLLLTGTLDQVQQQIDVIREHLAPHSLVVLDDKHVDTLKYVRDQLGDRSPVVAVLDHDGSQTFDSAADIRITPFAEAKDAPGTGHLLITPSAIDDNHEWDDFVRRAVEAESRGALFHYVQARESSTDRRALLTHAGLVLRPRTGVPIILAPCHGDAEALIHLNSDRADAVVGPIGHKYFTEAHRALGVTALLQPNGVVVVGASQDSSKPGNTLLRNLQAFPGTVVGLGRSQGEVHGRQVVSDVRELPRDVELAILAIPSQAVPGALEILAQQGIRTAIICSGGFSELQTDEGRGLQDQIDRIRDRYGIRILGPNTSGLAIPRHSLHASFVPAVTELHPGSVAVLAQSGGVAHAAALALEAEGLGVGAMVGVGNACDLDLPELLIASASSGVYKAIALHVEGTSRGPELLDAIRIASQRVPVVVLKSGVSDVDRLAASHTGALTGDWTTARSLLSEAGAVVVTTLGDLVSAVAVLSLSRLPASVGETRQGVGVITGQAGPGILLTDRLQTLGLEVPVLNSETESRLQELLPALTHRQNPVDTGRPGETFAEVLSTVSGDPDVAVIASYVLLEPGAIDLAATLKEAQEQASTPIVAASNGLQTELSPVRDELRSRGIPLLVNPESAALGVWALFEDQRGQVSKSLRGSPAETFPSLDPVSPPWNEAEAKALISHSGVKTPLAKACIDRAAATSAFDELAAQGSPVVVKVLTSEISHKSQAGGVHLNIRTHDELHRALDAIDAIPRQDVGYLVEEQLAPGLDLFVAVRNDPSWGMVGLIGHGGSDVEQSGDVQLFALPTSQSSLQDRLSTFGSDYGQIVSEVSRLFEYMAAALEQWVDLDIDSFEINPLRITSDGIFALDALVARG